MTTEFAHDTDHAASTPDIPAIVAGLRKTFASGRTRSVEWRRAQLKRSS